VKYPLVYGAIAGAIIVILSAAAVSLGLLGHSTSPLFGYLVMLVGLTMIFVGVKRYRDVERGGVVSFGKALAVALGIGLVAAIIYAAAFEIYLASSGIDFIAEYSRMMAQDMQAAGSSASEIEAAMAEMRAFGESYRNPLVRIPFHFLEIGPVCLVVALFSAALLRNPRILPARVPA
jgi:hypothetical membrane protein